MKNLLFPKNQSQVISLPWEYYISRNIPIWHDELTLLYNNDERGWPAYKLPANYVQLRVHHGDFADFYKFNTGDILIAKMTSVDFLPIMKLASAFVTDDISY